jgi:hypothetical protein
VQDNNYIIMAGMLKGFFKSEFGCHVARCNPTLTFELFRQFPDALILLKMDPNIQPIEFPSYNVQRTFDYLPDLTPVPRSFDAANTVGLCNLCDFTQCSFNPNASIPQFSLNAPDDSTVEYTWEWILDTHQGDIIENQDFRAVPTIRHLWQNYVVRVTHPFGYTDEPFAEVQGRDVEGTTLANAMEMVD